MLRLLAPPIMKRFAATSFALITLALVLNAAGDPAPGLETIRADAPGRVFMPLAPEPQETDPASRFKGAFNTVHAYNWWKPEVARRRGAAAMLMVQDRVNHRPPRAISGPTNAQIRTDRGQHTLTSPFWDIPMFTITRRVADE